jgi:hypothetical protein
MLVIFIENIDRYQLSFLHVGLPSPASMPQAPNLSQRASASIIPRRDDFANFQDWAFRHTDVVAYNTYRRDKKCPRWGSPNPDLHFQTLHFHTLHFHTLHFHTLHFHTLHFRFSARRTEKRLGGSAHKPTSVL